MKKLFLALFLLTGSIASANATCTGSAVMHDFPGTSFNMALGQDPSGGCASDVNILQNGALNAATNPFFVSPATGAIFQVQSNSANIATQTTVAAILTALGSPFQAGASIANTGFNGLQGGSALSATNGWYTNILQGNAVLAPTNPIWLAGAQAASTTMQSAAVANGNGTNLTVTGYQTALVNVNCSVACSGGTTINFEGTDSTGTYFSLAAFPVAGTSTAVNTATTSGQFWIPVSGLTTIRARISAYAAGTITVTGTPVFGINASLGQVVNALSSVQANNGTNGAASTVTTPVTEQNGSAYPNHSNWVSGAGSGTSTTAITIISAPATNSIYVKTMQCGRTDAGTTAIIGTLNDAKSSIVVIPANGGGGATNIPFDPPIKVAATTAFTITPGTGVSTLYCNAQGYNAP